MNIFNNSKKNNKGAVEMSLNLIIMLVIGLTVLGLIIGFVTNFLNQATDGVAQQLDDNAEQRLNEIRSVSGNLVAEPARMRINRGQNKNIYIKLENPFSSDISGIYDGTVLTTEAVPSTVSANQGTFTFQLTGEEPTATIELLGAPIDLTASEVESYLFELRTDQSVPTGTYFLTITFQASDGTDTQTYQERISLVVE